MDFKPITAVWEITMGCNLRCKHCGSSCDNALEGELTTKEALELCKGLGKLGFKWITISGGEPTTRKDWHIIANGLTENGVIPNMITNGWLMNEEIAKNAKEAGINTIAFSVDGLKETHDFIRREGSFDRIMNAMDIVISHGINCAVITTICNKNLDELQQMKELFIEKKVGNWQIQLGLPMGNMAEYKEFIVEPYHMNQIVDFAYEASKNESMIIDLADCMGYFDKKEIEIRKRGRGGKGYSWNGCGAGKYSIGILHNGDITGCTSIRDKSLIEGNIKTTPIEEIWNNKNSFAWNRNLSKDKLNGFCSKCVHGNKCKGGCTNSRLVFGGNIYASNNFCLYKNAVNTAKEQLNRLKNVDEMMLKARKFSNNKSYQLAGIVLEKIIDIKPDNIEALNLYGYVSFMMENYNDAVNANKSVLDINPDDAYANKGYGLSIARLGDVEKGIEYLKKSILNAAENFLDPYFDLSVIYFENNRLQEAIDILEEGRKKSADFKEMSEDFMNHLLKCKV